MYMVSIRGTATGPTFFTTYENPVEPDISQEFTVFKNIFMIMMSTNIHQCFITG